MAAAPRRTAQPETDSEADDALLAVRAAEGDEESFAVPVRGHAPSLVRLATRLLGDRAEAEDAVQDAFVSAWRRLPEFHGRAAFGTWIYRIVTNRCLNMLRARKPLADLEDAGEVPAPETTASPRPGSPRAATRCGTCARHSACCPRNNAPAGC